MRASKKSELHYVVVSVSLYREDVVLLAELTEQAKKRGVRRACKSDTIRRALALLRATEKIS